MLPRVDTKNRTTAHAAGGLYKLSGRSGVIAEFASRAVHSLQTLLFSPIPAHLDILVRHVAVLHPVMCIGPRTASIVCAEDSEQARHVFLEEPDEAVAKHCVSRLDHLLFQGIQRAKGLFDTGHHGRGWLYAVGMKTLEEKLVVAGHGSVIEKCGVGGIVGVFLDEIPSSDAVVDRG